MKQRRAQTIAITQITVSDNQTAQKSLLGVAVMLLAIGDWRARLPGTSRSATNAMLVLVLVLVLSYTYITIHIIHYIKC